MSTSPTNVPATPVLRRGLYETDYGNTAIYRGGRSALDLDMRERIPVTLLGRFIRPLTKEDSQ
jgi:hypothetical protein